MTDVIVSGDCAAPYEPVRRLLHSNLERGLDIGAAMAVTHHGELVADLWGGRLEPDSADQWERDTLVSGYSVGKIPIAIVALMLWDRGLLDLDAPIADRWPEFGRNGKERITTRQVLCHRAGVPSFGRNLTEDVLCDWDRMVGVVEEITPMFEPGTVSCYHPTTFGFILGELAQRCSGASLADLVRTELSEPLGVELYFGVADPTTRARVSADHVIHSELVIEPGSIAEQLIDEVSMEVPWTDPSRLAACVPGSGTTTNARALARIGAIIAGRGTVDGLRFLSADVVDEAVAEQSWADDEIFGWCRYGLGLGLHSDAYPAPTPTTVHWGGFGGALLTMDPATGIACAYTPNGLIIVDDDFEGERFVQLWRTIGGVTEAVGS